MSFSFVQAASQGTTNSSGARTIAFGSNVSAGDLLIVAVGTYTGSINETITDSQGNTYSQVGAYFLEGGAVDVSVWMATAKSTGANTVTVTPASSAYMGIAIAEFANAGATFSVDSTHTNGAAATTTPTTGSIPVSGAGELVIAIFVAGQTTATYTPGSGFTNAAYENAAAGGLAVALDYVLSASSAQTDNPTYSTTPSLGIYAAMGASFKATGGGGGSSKSPWFYSLQSGVCQGQGVG